MRTVIGVDGCRAGWIAAVWGETIECRLCLDFSAVLALTGEIIAVDMPIGFLDVVEDGGRTAEREARKMLSGSRKSSMFSSPCRAVVEANPATYAKAVALNMRHSQSRKKKLTQQSFNLIRKMHDIDCLMTPAHQSRVFEVHPELAFCLMNDECSIAEKKRTSTGRKIRLELLKKAGFPVPEQLPAFSSRAVEANDLVDAFACAWAARRILEKRARRWPDNPPRDAKGLRMEINA